MHGERYTKQRFIIVIIREKNYGPFIELFVILQKTYMVNRHLCLCRGILYNDPFCVESEITLSTIELASGLFERKLDNF